MTCLLALLDFLVSHIVEDLKANICSVNSQLSTLCFKANYSTALHQFRQKSVYWQVGERCVYDAKEYSINVEHLGVSLVVTDTKLFNFELSSQPLNILIEQTFSTEDILVRSLFGLHLFLSKSQCFTVWIFVITLSIKAYTSPSTVTKFIILFG